MGVVFSVAEACEVVTLANHVNLTWPFDGICSGAYSVVYADPPWHHFGDPNKDAAAGKHYKLMTADELRRLPVRGLVGDRGVLLVWATCPRLDLAINTLRAWGFHYGGVAFVWVKTTKAGKIIAGQGVRPKTVKPTTELVLVGTTTRHGRPLPILTEALGQVVLAPRGKHSEKPPEVRHRIEALYGRVPRIELFARERFKGWHAWGDAL